MSSGQLSDLRDTRPGSADWAALLKVTVGETASDRLPPVQGRYAVTERSVTFTPLFPFDSGRAYFVAYDPARLPRPLQAAVVARVVRLGAIERRPTTTVTAVHPAADVVPENTLRLYIEFSAPMGSRGAIDYVHLVDEVGKEVEIPFLPVEADFWNADRTRYTLFFDPGRVKDGILPNQQLGRPLLAGRRYSLEVSTDWRDAQGRPLAAVYRRRFRVGPAATGPLRPADWRIAAPAAHTRAPLVVTFPSPLDHGLLGRTLSVEHASGRRLDGAIALENADTRWVFTPSAPWEAGDYRLAAQSILEDPAGNRIGRAFEVDMTKAAAAAPPDTFRTPFRIAAP